MVVHQVDSSIILSNEQQQPSMDVTSNTSQNGGMIYSLRVRKINTPADSSNSRMFTSDDPNDDLYRDSASDSTSSDEFVTKKETSKRRRKSSTSLNDHGNKEIDSTTACHDASGQNLLASARISPITMQWLLQNFETADGVTLPRQTLYMHYLNHCDQTKLEPANSASFGKLIRSVFLGLKTRRLGTRGNSKYHYYGIRIKSDSELNNVQFDEDADAEAVESIANDEKKYKLSCADRSSSTVKDSQPLAAIFSSSTHKSDDDLHPARSISSQESSKSKNGHLASSDTYALTLNIGVPDLQNYEQVLRSVGLNLEHANRFFDCYKKHCEELFDAIRALSFTEVEHCWGNFWQLNDDCYDYVGNSTTINVSHGMNRTQLYTFCNMPVVQNVIRSIDSQFYQSVIDWFFPNVLRPLPNETYHSIRAFAKRLENGLAFALQGAPDVFVRLKLDAVSTLAQTLRRYTTIKHLSESASGTVFSNRNQVKQMLADFRNVDFRSIQHQASWICGCDQNFVSEIKSQFKICLEQQCNVEQWCSFLSDVVDSALLRKRNAQCGRMISVEDFLRTGKEFLLHWSFYSSLVIRDLTLRKAESFGSFVVIRMLFDEYLYYLVEQNVRKATGLTTISVMSPLNKVGLANNEPLYPSDYQSSRGYHWNSENGHVSNGNDQNYSQLIGWTTIAGSSNLDAEATSTSAGVVIPELSTFSHTQHPFSATVAEYFIPLPTSVDDSSQSLNHHEQTACNGDSNLDVIPGTSIHNANFETVVSSEKNHSA